MFVVRTATLPLKVGYKTGRLLGFRRLALVAAGVGAGLLAAPAPGRELRTKVRQLTSGRLGRTSDAELADRVRFELSHSSRTWHLPQPEVSAVAGRVILSGEAPNATARADLERTVAAVPGVTGVDNQLVISGTQPAT